MSEGLNCERVLSLVEQRDPIVVPTPPVGRRSFVVGIWGERLIVANSQHIFRRGHGHNRIVDGLAQRIVTEYAREAAVAHPRGQAQRAGGALRNLKLITRDVRTSRVDLIILGKRSRAPDVM